MSDPSAAIVAMADRFRPDGTPSGTAGATTPPPVSACARRAAPVPTTPHG